jgi:hypothetical protein
MSREHRLGDRTGPRAQIDRRAGRRQQIDGAASELLGVPAGHVDAGIDAELHVAERGAAGDPRQRFTREAALDECVQKPDIVAGGGNELMRLLVGGDEPGGREEA